jgi:hypothetical protein
MFEVLEFCVSHAESSGSLGKSNPVFLTQLHTQALNPTVALL